MKLEPTRLGKQWLYRASAFERSIAAAFAYGERNATFETRRGG